MGDQRDWVALQAQLRKTLQSSGQVEPEGLLSEQEADFLADSLTDDAYAMFDLSPRRVGVGSRAGERPRGWLDRLRGRSARRKLDPSAPRRWHVGAISGCGVAGAQTQSSPSAASRPTGMDRLTGLTGDADESRTLLAMTGSRGEWRQFRWFVPGFVSVGGVTPACVTLLATEPFVPVGAISVAVLLLLIGGWALVLKKHFRGIGPARHK